MSKFGYSDKTTFGNKTELRPHIKCSTKSDNKFGSTLRGGALCSRVGTLACFAALAAVPTGDCGDSYDRDASGLGIGLGLGRCGRGDFAAMEPDAFRYEHTLDADMSNAKN